MRIEAKVALVFFGINLIIISAVVAPRLDGKYSGSAFVPLIPLFIIDLFLCCGCLIVGIPAILNSESQKVFGVLAFGLLVFVPFLIFQILLGLKVDEVINIKYISAISPLLIIEFFSLILMFFL
ncbi:fam11a b protein [Anaeramoeba flamelloides]|uniref:Fam11a b protein n=1 Tax=Anaeramoeba flamelloides TaxID=1746091 RepID=A0AAV7Z276_9EUKA|nr:fam11a b protein [Anaeramoeba flamelloides]